MRPPFSGFVQFGCQLFNGISTIGGVSKRPAYGDPLSLPFFPLKKLLTRIAPAIAVLQPDIAATQRILKAFQQAQ